jgi:hypothetical protein
MGLLLCWQLLYWVIVTFYEPFQASSTITVGFICFLMAWIVMAIISFGFPFSFSGNTVWKVIFQVFPWTVLCQGYEILSASGDKVDLVALNGILVIQGCVYTLLAFYFNACMPDNDGRASLPWYLFDYRRIYPMVSDTTLQCLKTYTK